jgi:diaminohydroxyphosphoribosylaminopyrimidine deaminase / 5-amino-6-(5-phosphoribosylamino)uracil reductase
MRRALVLARRARHACRPNPMVGAVIVRDGRVLGEGYHHKAGEPHAEIEALGACTEDPRGADLYVTLEPCCHQGRTGPCTRAVVQAGIRRVVAATRDPNPRVSGHGFAELRAAGVSVEVGLLERQARELNEAFAWHAVTGRPFVTLKLAMTLDGRIADAAGRSQWITSERARAEVHRLRSTVDAILIGRGTAEADDPALTVRLGAYRGPQPLRVVLAGRGKLRPDLRLFTEGAQRTYVFAGETASAADLRRIEALGAHAERVRTEDGRIDPEAVTERLARLGVQRLLIEGGGRVAASFLDAALVHRVWFFYAPLILGAEDGRAAVAGASRPLSKALRLQRVRAQRFGPDLRVEGYAVDPLQAWGPES